MNTEKKFGFATRQIHAGHMENAAGSLCAPIYQTSTFAFSTVQQGGARFAGEEGGYIYTRLGNPTLGAVEEKLASLEGGEAAMAAASGMGAISSALWTSVVAGDEIVADETLYGCTYALLNHGMTKFGVKVTLTDLSDIENLKKNLTDKTRVVYFETPCNPTLKLLDTVPAASSGAGRGRGGSQRHQVPQRPRRRDRRHRGGQGGLHLPVPDVRPEGYDRRRPESL